MAPLPTIADTYRCALIWAGWNAVNVIHINGSGATPAGVANAIAASVSSGMWRPKATSDHITRIDITPLFDNGATFSYLTDGTAKWGGTDAGADVSPASAAVVSMKTVERGRSNRGRVFIGPVGENSMVNGKLYGTVNTDMQTAWAAFGSAIITHNMEHVVASYKHATALTVVNYSIRPALGTVRLRQSRLA